MNKDEIAIYLNEHPEFFNDYPELLAKIKSIDESDIPIKPMSTLSLANRILKRANDDKENLKNKLEWFFEISRTNEKIQENIFAIERLILRSSSLEQMVSQLKVEIKQRFNIEHMVVFLVDGADHFVEKSLNERYPGGLNGTLRFIEQATADRWFDGTTQPVLKGEIKGKSEVFALYGTQGRVKSEALVPMLADKKIAGVVALGSPQALRFYDGLRTDFLERLAEKLYIAIDHVLLTEKVRK